MNKRPVPITILACLYLIVGTIDFVVHLRQPLARHAFRYDDALIEVTQLIAIVCGLFMLRGRNWARWLAFAWIAFHVPLFFDSLHNAVMHVLLFGLIVYCLFRSDSSAYFKHAEQVDH